MTAPAGRIRRRGLHRAVFAVAGVYNLAWGAYAALDPQWLFRVAGMPPLNHPAIFACLGMVVGVYGFLYLEVARAPERGFAIAADTRTGYVALILTAAAASLAAATIFLRLPSVAPIPAPTHGPRLIALRDRPFLAFTLVDGLMSMHFSLLTIALPLWIAGHTTAPIWMISALTLVNTVLVVLLQVRAARSTTTVPGAARAARRA